jgi:hypothetical protein
MSRLGYSSNGFDCATSDDDVGKGGPTEMGRRAESGTQKERKGGQATKKKKMQKKAMRCRSTHPSMEVSPFLLRGAPFAGSTVDVDALFEKVRHV